MFLVGHASVGIAIVTVLGVTNPVAAFGIGWLSHYLADIFPHGDEPVGAWAARGNEIVRLFIALSLDGLAFLAVFAIFTLRQGWSWTAAAAAVGSFMPDILWGLAKVLKQPIFPVLEKFHHRNHNYFHPNIPAWVGMTGQLLVAVILWCWLVCQG